MIKQNQPTIFDSSVVVAVSSVSDGTMKFGVNKDKAALANRIKFLQANEISIDQSTPLSITYDRTDYADYRIVTAIDEGRGMRQVESMPVADALVTLRPEHALFLTLADCCGVVLHDPIRQTLMLSHVGRHSAEVDGAARSVKFLQESCNSNPADLKVWLSPAVGKVTYPITKKGGKGLQELILEQLASAGVLRGNIEVCEVDTAVDPNYFSHSRWKAGKQENDDRFAVVAMMRERSESAS